MVVTVNQVAWLVCVVGLCVVVAAFVLGADPLRSLLALVIQGLLTVLIARGSETDE